MDDWIDYYDSTHTIYASKLHRDVHFELIAKDIVGYVSSPDAVVLDYACGEALSAGVVATACGKLILAEPAPGVRGRLIARFAPDTKIRVRSLDDLRNMEEASLDLAIMNSCSQYMTAQELDAAFAVILRLLKPSGRLVLGDVLDPKVGMARDVAALLQLALKHGFFADALWGLVRTALSDYRQLRSRVGLSTYSEADMLAKLKAAGFTATRAPVNIGHNRWRMTFVARPAFCETTDRQIGNVLSCASTGLLTVCSFYAIRFLKLQIGREATCRVQDEQANFSSRDPFCRQYLHSYSS